MISGKTLLLILQAVPAALVLLVLAGSLVNRRADRIRRERSLKVGAAGVARDEPSAIYRSGLGPAYLLSLLALSAAACWLGYNGVRVAAEVELKYGPADGVADILFITLKGCFWAMMVAGVAGPVGLVIFVAGGIRYALDGHELRITVGAFRRMMEDIEMRPPFAFTLDCSIPLSSIIEIRPTLNPVSGPALSLRRLLVRYRGEAGGEHRVVISPEDREGFVAAVSSRTPALEILRPGHAASRRYAPELLPRADA